jgi:molybdenum cofactor synthesis domain-containing protein
MKMRPFGKLTSPTIAVERLLAAAHPITEAERLPLDGSVGRVAARTHRAPRDVPSFARATWDGYALASRDTRAATASRPAQLRVVGELFAEQAFPRPLRSGEAIAIATGAPVPRGTDSVLIFEEARLHGDRLIVDHPVRAGDRIARPGEDFPRGAALMAQNALVTPAGLGALAAAGFREVTVYRRPSVAIVPNGNELVSPGSPLGAGQIYESNNTLLSAFLSSSGAEPHPFPPVPDDPVAIERTVRRALRAHDLVLVTGGSSVGEHDFLPAIFPRLGRLLFHGISVRPGKPTLATSVGSRLVIGLPGHPTSCLANCFWLLRPVLRKLGHFSGPGTVPLSVRLAEACPVNPSTFSTVLPLRIQGGRAWTTFKGSSAITSLTPANGFAMLPPGTRSFRRGDPLKVHLLIPPVAPLPG